MENDEIIGSIESIYDRFGIIGNLRQHMKTVAAVGDYIMDSRKAGKGGFGSTDVAAALLLHDLGNIVKFDFGNRDLWKGYGSEEIENWRKAREIVAVKYGSENDHELTSMMVRELGAGARISFLVSNMVYENIGNVLDSDDFELKVCTYADQRVAPSGVVSVKQRFSDLRLRYAGRKGWNTSMLDDNGAIELQGQVFAGTHIHPEDVKMEVLLPYIRSYGAPVPARRPGRVSKRLSQ